MTDYHPPIAYSVNEACRVSSIGRTRIYGLIKDGHLKATKLGRRTLVDAESLKDLISPR
jgi:excisionase family DNA binding protein